MLLAAGTGDVWRSHCRVNQFLFRAEGLRVCTMAVLEFLTGERAGERLSLAGTRAVLGRHPECDVVLNEGAISRQHAHISLIEGEYFIEDLHSRNGTIVNGELVEKQQQLHDGDELKI